MIELIRSDDDIFIAWLRWRLAEDGITVHMFDDFTSRLYGGALAAIPRRIMVDEGDHAKALQILAEGRRLATRRS